MVAYPAVIINDTVSKAASTRASRNSSFPWITRLAQISVVPRTVMAAYSRSSSLRSISRTRPRTAMNRMEKLMPDRNMKMAAIHEISGE